MLARIKKNLEDWDFSFNYPEESQSRLLKNLLIEYSKTGYGIQHNASKIQTINDYRNNFPVVTYNQLLPYFKKIRSSNYHCFLSEPPITWTMTRGSTGTSKVIPITKSHLRDIIKGGSRAILNFSLKNGGLKLLTGKVLNLQFPSNISKMDSKKGEITYGFSSGTYAKLNPLMAGLSLIPRQGEIDALESDLTIKGWEKRYNYIYEKTKNENITTIIGVAPVQLGFARYIKKQFNKFPREIWNLKAVFSTSVAKIQSKYAPVLKKFYGEIPVIEMYTATEGAFGQQKNKLPYIIPNFDLYFFEVITKNDVKMLHEMKRGEWGRLVISSVILPRYLIGDLIECMGKRYYRVFGRDTFYNVIEHILYRTVFGWIL